MESLQHRPWYRKLTFERPISTISFSLIPKLARPYFIRNIDNTPHFKVKHSFFENAFFPSAIMEWNQLDREIQNTPSLYIFKKNILKFIKPTANSIINCQNLRSIKYLTRLRLWLSHL